MSATQTRMEYEVYRHNSASDRDFERINDIFKQVLKEDKDLCNAAQKNLNAGIFDSGELHPRVEKVNRPFTYILVSSDGLLLSRCDQGPLFFQQLTRKLVMEHRKAEVAAGTEIWAARPQQKSQVSHEEEVRFCASLDCGVDKDLSW